VFLQLRQVPLDVISARRVASSGSLCLTIRRDQLVAEAICVSPESLPNCIIVTPGRVNFSRCCFHCLIEIAGAAPSVCVSAGPPARVPTLVLA
jgi:hypothetical protein